MSATNNLEPGMAVYGHDGQRGEFVAMVRDRFLVRPIARFTGYDGEEFDERTDALVLWDRAYRKAPVLLSDEEAARIQAEIRDAQTALLATQREIAQAQSEHLATLKRLKRFEPLKNLEAILSGEITHVVEGSGYGGVKIKTFEEAAVYRDDFDRKNVLRMLSLKPTPDGEIQWHLNRWKDGSGSDDAVTLCASSEEAREAALASILRPLSWSNYETHPHLWAYAAANAEALGLTLPRDVIDKGNAYRITQAEEAIAKANDALEAAKAKRAEVAA